MYSVYCIVLQVLLDPPHSPPPPKRPQMILSGLGAVGLTDHAKYGDTA